MFSTPAVSQLTVSSVSDTRRHTILGASPGVGPDGPVLRRGPVSVSREWSTKKQSEEVWLSEDVSQPL